MKVLLRKLMNAMKEKVEKNLNEVFKNQDEFRNALKMAESQEKKDLLSMFFAKNKVLLNENLDYLKAQVMIINLIDKYRGEAFMNEKTENEVIPEIDFFAETIEGRMKFNPDHPLFHDDIFFKRLIDYYAANERYEECYELTQLKGHYSNLTNQINRA